MPKDVQNHFTAHMEAERKAQQWAEKAVAYQESGDKRKAKEAQNRAKQWLSKAMEIERKLKPRYPHT